jgi:hypothetical protein
MVVVGIADPGDEGLGKTLDRRDERSQPQQEGFPFTFRLVFPRKNRGEINRVPLFLPFTRRFSLCCRGQRDFELESVELSAQTELALETSGDRVNRNEHELNVLR